MTDHDLSPAMLDQAAIVQADVLETMARAQREGIDWRVILTGTSTAIADVVLRNVGPGEVPVFFARMSAMTMHLAEGAAS